MWMILRDRRRNCVERLKNVTRYFITEDRSSKFPNTTQRQSFHCAVKYSTAFTNLINELLIKIKIKDRL